MLVAFLITWFTSKKPAERIIVEDVVEKVEAIKETRKAGLRGVLVSTFGVYLLILILSSIANNGINNQFANIMPNVYGFDATTTSGLISLAGLLNIAFFLVAGRWMGKSGALPVFAAGNVARLVGALGMAVLGLVANSPVLLVVASVQILYQGAPFVRLAQPVVAVRFATIPAGQAVGWVIGASAIGSFLGSVIGGVLADKVGFNAINWMGAMAAGVAVLLTFISLWPAERKKRQEEAMIQSN
jgi:predicted MFS family arabinose efflux permease